MVFKGVATALITPFTDENEIDLKSLENLVEYQVQSGVNALVVLGTTGEPATMTEEEKAAVIKTAIRAARGRLPIIVGAGSNSTANAVKLCKFAENLGADALLCVTPYYNKCTQDGLIKHFGEIAGATSLPVICYNVPGRTGVNMLPSTFAELCKNKNIVAIKEASGNMEQISECLRLTGDFADVYSGDDGLTVPVMAMGGAGVISVASNVCPKFVADMTSAFFSGDLTKASAMQKQLLPLVRALFCEVNPIPVKRAAAALGLCKNTLRLPLTPMSTKNAEKLDELLPLYL